MDEGITSREADISRNMMLDNKLFLNEPSQEQPLSNVQHVGSIPANNNEQVLDSGRGVNSTTLEQEEEPALAYASKTSVTPQLGG